jgi:hypothetical protein
VIASKAHIDAVALKLRGSGLIEGTLDSLRALALVDLTQGRDPLDRIKPRQPADPAAPGPGSGPDPDHAPRPEEGEGNAPDPAARPADPGGTAPPGPAGPPGPAAPGPLPALINLLVPAATLLGWGTAPSQAAGWGLLDAGETSALVRAASQHPATRWCFTLTAPDGTAIAHACAKGQHPWQPPGPPAPQTARKPGRTPAPGQAAQLAELLRRFSITFEPVARHTCDHRNAENRYLPGRKLRHLIRARSQLCTAPACNNQAQHCDLDHTVPYPDGPSCECNLTPKCRRHHRTKQAPGWKVAQPAPDTSTWTTPSGRTHSTRATTYDL